MAYLVGIVLALVSVLVAKLTGLDRDRAFYPTLLIVIASYYVLFAVMGESHHALHVESIVMTLFALIAIAGFRFNLWLIVAAMAGHGVFDLVHGELVANPGVPDWWPPFCLAYDGVVAASLTWLLRRGLISRVAIWP